MNRLVVACSTVTVTCREEIAPHVFVSSAQYWVVSVGLTLMLAPVPALFARSPTVPRYHATVVAALPTPMLSVALLPVTMFLSSGCVEIDGSVHGATVMSVLNALLPQPFVTRAQ